MEIRELTIDELDRLADGAQEFFASSRHIEGFNLEVFKRNWTCFIEQNVGVIIGMVAEDGSVQGALGALSFPDLNSAEPTATECFWFVREAYRGKGLYLLKAFESWAKARDCRKAQMVHLMDLMPEKLSKVYERLGYELTEMHYTKRLVK